MPTSQQSANIFWELKDAQNREGGGSDSIGIQLYHCSRWSRRHGPTSQMFERGLRVFAAALEMGEVQKMVTPAHWERFDHDITKAMDKLISKQSSYTLHGGPDKGEINPNAQKNKAKFKAAMQLRGGGGHKLFMEASSSVTYRHVLSPGMGRTLLEGLDEIARNWDDLKAGAKAKGIIE